jgi:hypothetical protein
MATTPYGNYTSMELEFFTIIIALALLHSSVLPIKLGFNLQKQHSTLIFR